MDRMTNKSDSLLSEKNKNSKKQINAKISPVVFRSCILDFPVFKFVKQLLGLSPTVCL